MEDLKKKETVPPAVTPPKKEAVKRTYLEKKEARRFFVLVAKCNVLGVWSNLKKLCEEMREKDEEFPGYHTLVRIDKSSGELNFASKSGEQYQIKIEQVK
jgi:hypothetical protein